MDNPLSRCVRVCQNRTCRQQGAEKVLAAFLALPLPELTISGSGCLGQCGNGPMVLILPEKVFYPRVRPEKVALLIEQHLLGVKR